MLLLLERTLGAKFGPSQVGREVRNHSSLFQFLFLRLEAGRGEKKEAINNSIANSTLFKSHQHFFPFNVGMKSHSSGPHPTVDQNYENSQGPILW